MHLLKPNRHPFLGPILPADAACPGVTFSIETNSDQEPNGTAGTFSNSI
jgi:hypothetical protein